MSFSKTKIKTNMPAKRIQKIIRKKNMTKNLIKIIMQKLKMMKCV